MHFSKIMFAVAALACGSAFAATPVAQVAISSGASASKGNLKLALINRCVGGQLGEFASGNNISTYVCANAGAFANANAPTAAEYNASTPVNFAGTAFAELRLNVANGSFSAVCLLATSTAGSQCPTVADTYVNPASGTLVAAAGTGTIVGGLSDLERGGYTSQVTNNVVVPATVSTISAQFGQTFGVAASNDLWVAMQADQVASGKLPNTCTGLFTPECTPVIGKPQMATIMSSNSSNDAYVKGANFLAPSQLAAGTVLKYGRRVDTSGTQAVAQQYFLGNVCSPANIGVVAQGNGLVGTPIGAITVYGLGSTGNLRTILTGTSPNYAIGVMSGENNQSESWKWLRVAGTQMADNAVPGTLGVTNTRSALDGRNDFWFLSRIVRPVATASDPRNLFWASVIQGFAAVPAGTTPGLFAVGETLYTKGQTNSCLPAASN